MTMQRFVFVPTASLAMKKTGKKKCKDCGKSMPAGARKCPHCGC